MTHSPPPNESAGPRSAARQLGHLEQLVQVETPEQVVLSYTVAGIGSRATAAIIDTLILALITIGPILVIAAAGGSGFLRNSWFIAIYILLQFAIVVGYFVFFEALRDGQTPGKAHVGLRVVRDGGYAVTGSAALARNLLRIIDMQPGVSYGVGMLSMLLSPSSRRLGDIVGGTIVVQERVLTLAAPPAVEVRDGKPAAGTSALSTLLTDHEYTVLERYVSRRAELQPERRRQIAAQLLQRFGARLDPEWGEGPGALVRLHDHERRARARGVAARSETGAAREQHALVAIGGERWREFATMLADAQRRGLRSMSEQEVSEFAARYRDLATDLARLQTATRGREADALFYLNRLVAAGHNLLYRRREVPLASVWRYVAFEIPREIRRSWRPLAAAAFLLFAPGAVAYRVIEREPHLALQLVHPGMLDRAESAARRDQWGEGYIDDPREDRPILGSAIIVNNVRVAILAYAAGVLAGVGTAFVLFFNGVQLGGVLGLYAGYGVLDVILAFVAPHGVLELFAIVLAGAAGLLIGAGMLFPGAYPRRTAIIAQSRRGLRLVAGATLLLLAAGIIEGLISPIPWWPLEWKLFVSLITALLLIFYITRGRGVPAPPFGA